MADSILRLKVDSQEYDQKIKRAAEGIQQYAQKCREAGGTLQYLDDGVLEFVQALGKMDTVATGTKQQLREMSNALTTLTQTYRGLTDEEKASPFGQELAKGIQQLTERAGQAQDAMADVQASIRNAASDTRLFDQMAQGMSVATAGFQGLTGAGKLLGIEMGNDVEVIAKLQAAMAVTNSLTTIQTALQKQSALMQGVQAVQASAAAAAQTALAAATGNATLAQKAFNVVANMNPYVALATAIVACGAALYAFSSNSKDAEKAQKALNIELDHTKAALDQIDKDTDFSVGIAEAAGKSWDAIHKLRLEAARTKLQLADLNYDKLFESGASPEQLKQAQEMQKQAWDNVMKILNEGTIREIQKRNGTGPFAKGKGGSGRKNVDTNYADDSIMAQEKEVQRLTDAWNRASGAMRDGILKDLEAAKQKLEEMKKIPTAELGDVVVTGSKMKGVTKAFENGPINFDSINTYISGIRDQLKNADLGSEMYNSLTEKMKDATTMQTLLQELMDRGMEGADLEKAAASLKEKLLSPEGIDQEAVQKWLEELNKKIKDAGGVPLELNTQTGEVTDKKDKKKDDKSFSKEFSNIVGGVSSIASGIQQMGVEMPKELQSVLGVLSGISSIMTGITALLTLIQIDTKTTAVASTADAIIPFANGGIVPHAASGILMGRSFSGDNIGNVRLNAGELVLNKAQQYTLSQQLTDGGFSGVQLDTVIGAEEIRLVLNNNGRRTGRGEYVQNRNRRF